MLSIHDCHSIIEQVLESRGKYNSMILGYYIDIQEVVNI